MPGVMGRIVKIVVFGAAGVIGRAVTTELLARGHTVTAATRSGAPVDGLVVQSLTGDARDPASVARLAAGQDAVASATGPRRGHEDPEDSLLGAARGLAEGLRRAGVRRLVVVGGAGSLEVTPGERLVDRPDFPPAHRPAALAHARALDEVYRHIEDLDWTYVSPARLIGPGERTGEFRVGGDRLLADESGESRISIPDFAIAVADELEHGEAFRRRITVAY
jgi:putative NADH-flavin reductase